MVLGSAKFGEAALFLSIVGSANFVFISFVPVILYFTHVEYIGSPADIPWAYLCGVAALLFVVDLYTCDINFNTVRLIAVFIICLGFLMLLLPEDWDQCIIRLTTKLRKRDDPAEAGGETGANASLNWRGRGRTSLSTYAR
ncbi:hypothetical protein GOODEAATRI_026954 [Goodea atripinnis]|uniref:Uncharacterized protein n=1 Tax=Goodea atripinnis TaxID=208336 RepID=A0ABV0P861_9TELE